MCQGVSKSGSPTPRDTMSFDCATMSKNFLIPLFGNSATCGATLDFKPILSYTSCLPLKPTPTPYFISSSASFSSCASLSALSAPLIVTTVSQNAMSLDFSNMPFITFAAIGAHEPFSMRPIVRFW